MVQMSQRKPLFAANWKMHKTSAEATSFVRELLSGPMPDSSDYLIAASFTLLSGLRQVIGESPILLAAQNMFFEEQGAFTGEISPLQLKDIGVTHVIIGHSERRHIFGESDELLNKKLLACQNYGLIPVFCLGETSEERESGKAAETIKNQLSLGINGLNAATVENMIVAYEPVWAIGTGKTASPEQVEEMHHLLRQALPDTTRLLYGGSVKPDNSEILLTLPSVDGFLVGGAALDPATFRQIFQ